MSNNVGVALQGDPQTKSKYKNKLMSNAAITLIALVITIIVLLILAGVTLNMVIGENGIFAKAKWSGFVTEFRQVEEAVQVYTLDKQAVQTIGNQSTQIFPIGEKIEINDTASSLQQTIEEIDTLETAELYKIDKTNINIKEDYVVNIDTGTIYKLEAFKYKGKAYHRPDSYEDIDKELTINITDKTHESFTINLSNYPTEAGTKYKYYVTKVEDEEVIYPGNNYETETTKEITNLAEETEYEVKVEVYTSAEEKIKVVTKIVKTEDSTRKIYSIEDLEEINTDTTTLSLDYKLMKNLDFKDRNSYETQARYNYYNQDLDSDGNPDNSWTPIGNINYPFKGVLNGDGKTISNLYINSEDDCQGLFGSIGVKQSTANSTIIENLKLQNINITSNGRKVAAIAGYMGSGTIEKVFVSASISGSGYVGSIVGENGYGYVKECFSNSIVKSDAAWQSTGGIIGSRGSVYESCQNCLFTGSVEGKPDVSGIAGRLVDIC